MTVLVTGGAGYVGAVLTRRLVRAGERVRVLDGLVHGQDDVITTQRRHGVEHVLGDVRDPEVRRAALQDVSKVVHLAAIVGDPACARDPIESHDVNVVGSAALLEDAAAAQVERFVFASTCSNYGRRDDPAVAVNELADVAPVSLYAEQKVTTERAVLDADSDAMRTTVLRFATVYGVAPRMRFDLTVNEFTRDLWAGRVLEVFGEQFWRPYVHVRDAAQAVATVLASPGGIVGGQVFNAGRNGENYRKKDLVGEIRRFVDAGSVRFVRRTEDPRDYKVSFQKIADVLGFHPAWTVQEGIREVLVALRTERFGDPFAACYRN